MYANAALPGGDAKAAEAKGEADERKSERSKWVLPDSFDARSRGVGLVFTEVVRDYQHKTLKTQMEEYIAISRSYCT